MKRQSEPAPSASEMGAATHLGGLGSAGVESLAAYDERLRQGTPGLPPESDAEPSEATPPGELADCLNLLERIWPRSGDSAVPSCHPRQIGRFEIEGVLGHGGFGIVYLAKDPLLARHVAVKVPRLHSLIDDDLRERFRREARAAATLDHPHIVPVHESGEDGPMAYIVSAYCAGTNLADWLRQQTLAVAPRLAAKLTAQLAEGVHYSHAHGILHRDIKPGNVMLVPAAQNETVADEDLPFIPRLTDFGLAKILDDHTRETAVSAMLGTPTYMAPEQVGSATDVAVPATDIYALGVLLYEMLTGCPPFQGSGVADILDQIRHQEPVAPRRLRRDIPRDLETICLKCLEKSPQHRFASARELADELHRFLRGEPLRTKPAGALGTVARWVRRRRLTAAFIALLVVTAIAVPTMLLTHNRRLAALSDELAVSLATATHWQSNAERLREQAEQAADSERTGRREAEAARSDAEAQRALTGLRAYASSIRLAEGAWRDGDVRQCRALLNDAASQAGGENAVGLEWRFLDRQIRADYRELGSATQRSTSMALFATGQKLAVGNQDGGVEVVDLVSNAVTARFDTAHGIVCSAAWSRSGDQLATCGDNQRICVWQPGVAETCTTSPPAPGPLNAVVWIDNDNSLAAAGGSGFAGVWLWKPGTANETFLLPTGREKVTALTSSPDGQRLVAAGHGATIWIWDASSQELLASYESSRGKLTALRFSDDGRLLAVGGNDQRVVLYHCDGSRLKHIFTWRFHDDIRDLAISPNGDCLAVIDQFGTISVRDIPIPSDPPKNSAGGPDTSTPPPQSWQSHERRGLQVSFRDNGTQVVSVGGDSPPRLWTLRPRHRQLLSTTPVEKGYELPLLWTSDSQRVVTSERGVRFWSIASMAVDEILGSDHFRYSSAALSADGQFLAAGSPSPGQLRLWNLEADRKSPLWSVSVAGIDSIAIDPYHKFCAVADWTHDVVITLDGKTGQPIGSLPARQCHEVALSPDGRFLAVDDQDDVVVWETTSWTRIATLRGHLSTILTMTFSPEGEWLVSGGRDREIRMWRTSDWSLHRTLNGHRSEVQWVRFTRDGRSLLALDGDDYVRLWHTATGLELCSLHVPAEGAISHFALSPDTRHLALRDPTGRVEIRSLWSDSLRGPQGRP